ncbi:MAG: DUF2567 domain-containing protein [Gordonia sp. (in: high G+C Gram-positive bacteria)]
MVSSLFTPWQRRLDRIGSSVSRVAGLRRPVSTIIAVAAVIVLLGVLVGATWSVTTPAISGRVTAAGPTVAPQQIGEEFAGVGVFWLLMFGYGAVSAILAWFAARHWRGLIGYATAFGAVIAGTGIAGWVGTGIAHARFTGPHDAARGHIFRVVPDLWPDGYTRAGYTAEWIVLICAPLALSFVYLLCVLLSGEADLGVGDGTDEPVNPGLLTSGV